MKNIVKISVWASLLVLAAACTKDFEKINTDPDAYTTVPMTNMLAYVHSRTAVQVGDITGPTIWAGYMCKLSYIDQYNDYIPTNNTYGNKWYQVYWGSVQLNDIIARTDESVTKNMHNAAIVMKDFLLLWNLDCFGDMPYFDAFKGAPEDGGGQLGRWPWLRRDRRRGLPLRRRCGTLAALLQLPAPALCDASFFRLERLQGARRDHPEQSVQVSRH